MNGFTNKFASSAAKSAKQSAQAAAKRIAQEHLETLKSAKAQVGLPVSGEKQPQTMENTPGQEVNPQSAPTEPPEQMSARLATESRRLLENLEAELAQIRKAREQEELQKKQREEQDKAYAVQQTQAQTKEPPTIMGKVRKAVGGMKAKAKGMASKHEKQRPVSG